MVLLCADVIHKMLSNNHLISYCRWLYSVLQARVYSEIAQLRRDTDRTGTRIPDFRDSVSEPQHTVLSWPGHRGLAGRGWRHSQCAMLWAPGNQQLSNAPEISSVRNKARKHVWGIGDWLHQGFVFVKSTLLSSNLHTMKFTHFKVDGFWQIASSCNHHFNKDKNKTKHHKPSPSTKKVPSRPCIVSFSLSTQPRLPL